MAFKLTTDELLPPLPYFTFVDFYVYSCLLFLIGTTVIHAALPMYYYAQNENSVLTLPVGNFDDEAGGIREQVRVAWRIFILFFWKPNGLLFLLWMP